MPTRADWIPASTAHPPLFAGVDLGGTNIKVGLVDDVGQTLAFHTEPTQVDAGPDDVCRRMGLAVHTVAGLAGVAPDTIARVGLGTPGPQDLKAGTIIKAGNLPRFDGYPVRDAVSRACGLPVSFANDATAAGYGEFWIGSAREFGSSVLLTLGTGVGGGIVIDGVPLEGAHSHGAECGHNLVDPSADARHCPCGQPGHLEAYCSATALKTRARDVLAAGATGSLARVVAGGAELTPILISREAAAGDPVALDLILDVARWLGIGIVTLMHTVDPDAVLLGGAMTFGGEGHPVGKAFIERIRAEVRSRTFPLLAERTAIRFARLGGDAGYVGAAGIARLEHQRLSRPGAP
ncbi:MAG: ROK family protein [Planctomycetia bacterium]|nr:ROK family protein [Planctomycetia bacterium]